MLGTTAEIAALQRLLDESLGRSGEHLRSIIEPGRRTPPAETVCRLLEGMKVLVVATVGPGGRPRTSAVDGHFLHGHPAVSTSYIDGERFALFTHGDAEFLEPGQPDYAAVDGHLTSHYGASPTTWGPSIAFIRVRPRWSVAYAFDVATLG